MIDAALLDKAEEGIADFLANADRAAAEAARQVALLIQKGLDQMSFVGVHASHVGPAFHYAGIAQKAATDLIAALGGVHHELHALKKRLAPNEPTPQAGGGGGKGDPPPPVE